MEQKALLYAERYGIIEYQISDGFMIYEEYCGSEGTYLCKVNLDTMEEKREMIK